MTKSARNVGGKRETRYRRSANFIDLREPRRFSRRRKRNDVQRLVQKLKHSARWRLICSSYAAPLKSASKWREMLQKWVLKNNENRSSRFGGGILNERCDGRSGIPKKVSRIARVCAFVIYLGANAGRGKILQNGTREREKERYKFPTCRARVTFQGLLVRSAHPVALNVGAALGRAARCINVRRT